MMMYSMVSEYLNYDGPQQLPQGSGQSTLHHHHQTPYQGTHQETANDFYYGSPVATREETCNIITSDNGLSYTNLDYSTSPCESGGVCHGGAHQQYCNHPSNADYYPEYVYHPQQHHQPQPPPQPPETYHGHHQHYNNPQQNHGQHSAPVPTYKWMQVKRNVPKPGKIKLLFSFFNYGIRTIIAVYPSSVYSRMALKLYYIQKRFFLWPSHKNFPADIDEGF
jgi:hypothetical protein